MDEKQALDEIDWEILNRLRANGRETASSIAKHVNLTASTVRRRIERLEETGVIERYTIGINHDKAGSTVEAYIALRFAGGEDGEDVHETLRELVRDRPDVVREAMTVSGDTDALVRVRVQDLLQLRHVVMDIRKRRHVIDSKTLIVLGNHWWGNTATVSGTQGE